MIKAVYQFLVVFFQIIFPAKRAVRVGGLSIPGYIFPDYFPR
jgi:hypothetical protein